MYNRKKEEVQVSPDALSDFFTAGNSLPLYTGDIDCSHRDFAYHPIKPLIALANERGGEGTKKKKKEREWKTEKEEEEKEEEKEETARWHENSH